jgi:hypothetical protein
MANTTARRAALSAARCRSRTYPRAGIATAAPASSIHRPTIRNAQWPRRHRPNRSADAGSCSRPAETGCAGRSRSGRGPHCGAGVSASRRSRGKANEDAMNASWAACRDQVRVNARGSEAGNRCRLAFAPHIRKYCMFLLRCSKGSVDDRDEPDYVFNEAGMTESFGVELGPLPLPVLGAWGKEPT